MKHVSSRHWTSALRRLATTFRRRLRRSRLLQVARIAAMWCGIAIIVQLAGLSVPSGIVGMVLVLILLATRRISLFTLRRGAEWFTGEMMLFFVPAVVSVLDHREFIGPLGIALVLLILLSTLSVMAVTAMTVELAYLWRTGHEQD